MERLSLDLHKISKIDHTVGFKVVFLGALEYLNNISNKYPLSDPWTPRDTKGRAVRDFRVDHKK